MLMICGILFPFFTSAKTVSQAKAIETANLFFYGSIPTRAVNGVSLKWSSAEIAPATKSGDESPAFYVFSGNDEQGFVIKFFDNKTFGGGTIAQTVELAKSYKYSHLPIELFLEFYNKKC